MEAADIAVRDKGLQLSITTYVTTSMASYCDIMCTTTTSILANEMIGIKSKFLRSMSANNRPKQVSDLLYQIYLFALWKLLTLFSEYCLYCSVITICFVLWKLSDSSINVLQYLTNLLTEISD